MDSTNHQRPADPLPEEIRQICARIRGGWTAHEERKRAAWADTGPWTPPEASILLLADVGAQIADEPK